MQHNTIPELAKLVEYFVLALVASGHSRLKLGCSDVTKTNQLLSRKLLLKMLVSAIHIAHCLQEMIAISSDACYQILSCAHV